MRHAHRTAPRRPARSRRGSVLILVVALLVLLALMGTAYLSSTSAERGTSVQHAVNTEGDLLVQGFADSVNAQIVAGVFGDGPTGPVYRPPSQDMPTYDGTGLYAGDGKRYAAVPGIGTAAFATPTGYAHFDAVNGTVAVATPYAGTAARAGVDLFLANRVPTAVPLTGQATWGSGVSWPPFASATSGGGGGGQSFDSPFSNRGTDPYLGRSKGSLDFRPTSYTAADGSIQPGFLVYVPPAATLYKGDGTTVTNGAQESLLTPTGLQDATAALLAAPVGTPAYAALCVPAADTDGDGIADAVLFKLPGGAVAGVTYYGAYRVVDGNSAVNVNTAWSSNSDLANTSTGTAPPTFAGNPGVLPSPNDLLPNYGFFRSGVGLLEMCHGNGGARLPESELAYLNSRRFNGDPSLLVMQADSKAGHTQPVGVDWYSAGDAMDQQLIRRPGNPGYYNGTRKFLSFGPAESSLLARGFVTQSAPDGLTELERDLPFEVSSSLTSVRYNPRVKSQPYDTADVARWFTEQFDYQPGNTTGAPLRPLLTAGDPVSNAVPSRFLGADPTPPVWAVNTIYHFGDVVTETVANGKRTYACLTPHLSAANTEPGTGAVAGPGPYWAGIVVPGPAPVSRQPGLPWTRQAVKTSINTAPFEELWLAYCQVMTDSYGYDFPTTGGATPMTTGTKQWLPPLKPGPVAGAVAPLPEQQLPMFRSVLRGASPLVAPAVRLTASQMLKIRAALAAVNAIDARDGDDDVTSRRIILFDPTTPAGSTPVPQYDVEVFGTEAQPYLGAVYAHVDAVTPANNFVAMQFVNPFPQAITVNPATGWRLGTVNRSGASLTMTAAAGLVLPSFTIPGRNATNGQPGLAVIEGGTRPVNYVAPTPSATVTDTMVVGLESTIGSEVYLMKPRKSVGAAAGTSVRAKPTGAAALYGEAYDEAADITDQVPVDSIDLSSLAPTDPLAPPVDYLHRRGTDPTAMAAWNFVYPGAYPVPPVAPQPPGPVGPAPPAAAVTTPWFVKLMPAAGANAPPDPAMGGYYGYSATVTAGDPTGATPTTPTYDTVPLVLNAENMAGPNRLAGGTMVPPPANRQFPFGGFARQGDMLAVPFIGAYRIRALDPATGLPLTSPQTFVEMNTVSMDSSLAEDTTLPVTSKPKPNDAAGTEFKEQIGRFCPVGLSTYTPAGPGNVPPPVPPTMDFNTDANASLAYHYHWAARLFEYLTVQAPTDDFTPNVDPARADAGVTPNIYAKYPGDGTPVAAPVPVANQGPKVENNQTPGTSEDTTGVDGLININTGPAQVLAALPFYVPAITVNPKTAITVAEAQQAAQNNLTLATAIVAYRNANGPFRTIMDLYRVPAFRAANDVMVNAPIDGKAEPGPADGVFSPYGIGGIGSTDEAAAKAATAAGGGAPRPRYDFQERFLLLNRISNLITVRSDTFTCYVQVQGYRDVGVTGVTPTLVVQRRAAYLLDRTGVTPTNHDATRFTVPSR